jgi:prostaglandin-H2 D-isomerase / glutathione transferase
MESIGRTLFVTAFLSQNKEDYAKHQQGDRKHYLAAIERHLQENASAQTGPYIIGNEFTYGDILLYQVLHDESLVQNGRKELQDYPRINKFVEATEARPNIKSFLKSDRYRG